MAKQNNFWIWIILAVLVILFIPKYGIFFIITGEEIVTREFPIEITAGTNQGIRYIVSGASGLWGVSIVDSLLCPGYPEISKKTVILSDIGDSLIVFYQLPDVEGLTCTFSGNYQFGDKPIKNLAYQTISTKIACQSGADIDKNGIIERTELGAYITQWKSNIVTRSKLGEAIMEWVNGC